MLFQSPHQPGTVGTKGPNKPQEFYLNILGASQASFSVVVAVTGSTTTSAAGSVTETADVNVAASGSVVTSTVGTVAVTATATISGVTKDSTSTPLGSCTLHLFLTSDDSKIATTTSDGGGNYILTFSSLITGPFYIVAYKVGSPDVAGTTLNTLVAGS